jgi:prevent-host-death family protein
MARTRYSVAEARQYFARLIRDAEQGRAVEITRRGEPVAVLLSASGYQSLTGGRRSFLEAVGAVRERLHVERLGIDDADFDGLRDDSPGREVPL